MLILSNFNSVITKNLNQTLQSIDNLNEKGKNEVSLNEESLLRKFLSTDRRYGIRMAFDVLFAGIDATSASTALLLYQLAVNQEKQKKLRDEVFTLLPNIDSPLTTETLENAPYFRACLKECYRVQPIIPGHMRGTGQDLVLEGYQVPKMVYK